MRPYQYRKLRREAASAGAGDPLSSTLPVPGRYPIAHRPALPLRGARARGAAFLWAAVLCAPSLQAATIFVTNSNDSGSGSLRAAIEQANAGDPNEPQLIAFVEGVDGLTPASALPELQHPNISLRGAGGTFGTPTIDGEDNVPLLRVASSVERLALSDLVLERGRGNSGPGCLDGIGVLGSAVVEIDRVQFLECRQDNATTAVGGSVYLNGAVRISDSRIEQGLARGAEAAAGGGVAFGIGSLLIESSVIGDNSAVGANSSSEFGGGVAMIVPGAATLEIRDSRISQNSAGQGGGIYARNAETLLIRSGVVGNAAEFGSAVQVQALGDAVARLTIDSSTILDNNASQRGALHLIGTTAGLRMRNATFWNNSAGDAVADLPGAHLSLQGALLQSVHSTLLGRVSSLNMNGPTAAASACVLNSGPGSNPFVAGNVVPDTTCAALMPQIIAGDAAALGLGLPEQTAVGVPYFPLLPDSPLLDAGVVDGTGLAAFDDCSSLDVRGVARPADGDLDGTARCDVGAFERNIASIFGDGFEQSPLSASPGRLGPAGGKRFGPESGAGSGAAAEGGAGGSKSPPSRRRYDSMPRRSAGGSHKAGPGYRLGWWTVDAGGGRSIGTISGLRLDGTLGQAEPETVVLCSVDGGAACSGAAYRLRGGFWAGFKPSTSDTACGGECLFGDGFEASAPPGAVAP